MENTHLDEHQELCLALYRQRQGLLKETCADSSVLASVEYRLRAHLFVLSHYIDEQESEPASEHEVFVYLARRILAFDEEVKVQAWSKAIEWLAESGAKALGAKGTLILFPPDSNNRELLEIAYQNYTGLRPDILNIWQKTNTKISSKLINRSDLLSESHELQVATIEYATYSADYTKHYFQNYYMPIIDGKNEVHEHLLAPSIFGGLIRGDSKAKTALLRGIEQFPNTAAQVDLLRLAALSGDAELLSVLEGYKKSSPAIAFYLLAMHGHKRAVPLMIDGLKQANQLSHAEQGWNLLTNVDLPQIARMYLASDANAEQEEFDDEYDDEIFELDDEFDDDFEDQQDTTDMIPDVSVAIQWWQENKEHWQDSNRYFRGEVADTCNIAKLAKQAVGRSATDLLHVLLLELKEPTNDFSESWFEIRQNYLDTYSNKASSTSSAGINSSNSEADRSILQRNATSSLDKPYAHARKI